MDLIHKGNTVREILHRAAEKLGKAGITESRTEAEILLSFVMNTERWKLYLIDREIVSPEVKQSFLEAVKLRENKCPVAYITGIKEFYGLEFTVFPGVLIPRPETEFLIDAVINTVKNEWGHNEGQGLNILDLGTGSGAIVVTLAKLLPRSSCHAVDISPEALGIARKNSFKHKVENRIQFLQGNYWESFTGKYKLFHVIVSNPPYIPRKQLENLPCDIREYEPRRALDGGEDGLDSYRQILEKVGAHSSRPAFLALEVGADISEEVKELCRQEPVIKQIKSVRDYRDHERVILAMIS